MTVESWRTAWRVGVAPQLSVAGLEALARALEQDDDRLLQGDTSEPSLYDCFGVDRPVEKACAIGFCGWQGDGLGTVTQAEDYLMDVCDRADQALDEAAGSRWFVNWVDETPRDEMRRLLLPEVRLALAGRAGVTPGGRGG